MSFANRWNADLIDENYEKWAADPSSVSVEWQTFFEGFELGLVQSPPIAGDESGDVTDGQGILQSRVIGAIYAFRSIGHTQALYNPLESTVPVNPRLSLDRLGIADSDLNKQCHTGNYMGGKSMRVGEVFDNLRATYCGKIGVEYIHIQGDSSAPLATGSYGAKSQRTSIW